MSAWNENKLAFECILTCYNTFIWWFWKIKNLVFFSVVSDQFWKESWLNCFLLRHCAVSTHDVFLCEFELLTGNLFNQFGFVKWRLWLSLVVFTEYLAFLAILLAVFGLFHWSFGVFWKHKSGNLESSINSEHGAAGRKHRLLSLRCDTTGIQTLPANFSGAGSISLYDFAKAVSSRGKELSLSSYAFQLDCRSLWIYIGHSKWIYIVLVS